MKLARIMESFTESNSKLPFSYDLTGLYTNAVAFNALVTFGCPFLIQNDPK